MKNKILKSIPNIITSSRIITCILAAICFVMGNIPSAVILYCYSAISDCLDGMLARKLNAYSELGRKLDAISDKIFIGAAIAPSIALGNYLMIVPLLLETCILAITACKQIHNVNPRTERIGKFKSCFLFPTVILGLIGSKIPVINLLMAPLFYVSTVLEVESIKTYAKQEHLEKDDIKGESLLKINDSLSESEQNKNESSLTKMKKQYMSLRNELAYYLSNNSIYCSDYCFDEVTMNKVRERKR